jgi:hypothetical protein
MPFAQWARYFWISRLGFLLLAALCLGLRLYTHALWCDGMIIVDTIMIAWTEHLHKEFKDFTP